MGSYAILNPNDVPYLLLKFVPQTLNYPVYNTNWIVNFISNSRNFYELLKIINKYVNFIYIFSEILLIKDRNESTINPLSTFDE